MLVVLPETQRTIQSLILCRLAEIQRLLNQEESDQEGNSLCRTAELGSAKLYYSLVNTPTLSSLPTSLPTYVAELHWEKQLGIPHQEKKRNH